MFGLVLQLFGFKEPDEEQQEAIRVNVAKVNNPDLSIDQQTCDCSNGAALNQPIVVGTFH